MQLNVAKEFSRFPAGRFVSDGAYSGEAFRAMLAERLRQFDKVVVELDGPIGYSSSFLEEAFGGLVRLGLFSYHELLRKLELRSASSTLREEVWSYMSDARRR